MEAGSAGLNGAARATTGGRAWLRTGQCEAVGAKGYFGRRLLFFGRVGLEGKRSGEIGTSDVLPGGSVTSLMAGGAAAGASPRTPMAVGADSPPESTESMSLTIAAFSAKSEATFADGGGGGAGGGGAGGGGREVGAGEPASTLPTRPTESSSRASAS